ncbi:MFS transporter, partial [Clavibacter michiganensis]|uniref:MFS transporter n=1 Tax=Clavibacter michiganensis TaxID=28447 RepID=UPI00292D55FA
APSALRACASARERARPAPAPRGASAPPPPPAALARLSVTVPSGPDRVEAVAVYGAIAGSGAAVGVLLGGVLTEYLSWHWCLLVNVPIEIVAIVAGIPLVK